MGKAVIHLLQRMDDEVYRRLDAAGDAIFADQPVIELRPIFDAVGQPLVADDDEQIIVGLVALGGMRLIDLGAARIAAIEDHLEDPARLLPLIAR